MSGDTRDRLLAATRTVIAAEGWGAVTTRRVAEVAGVGAGLVHYHAGSVAALRRDAVLDVLSETFGGAMAEGPASAEDVEAWLRRLLLLPTAGSPAVTPETLRLLHESLPAAAHDEALRETIAELLRRYRAGLTEHLRTVGLAEPEATAALLAALVDGALLQRSLDPRLDLEPVVALLSTQLRAVRRDL